MAVLAFESKSNWCEAPVALRKLSFSLNKGYFEVVVIIFRMALINMNLNYSACRTNPEEKKFNLQSSSWTKFPKSFFEFLQKR